MTVTARTEKLRRESLDAVPEISEERAVLLTGFYRDNHGKHSVPVTRALAFHHLCTHKQIHLGDAELIVGERGPAPKKVPTYPELTCHSLEDLEILNGRPRTSYRVPKSCRDAYESEIIPYWKDRSLRERIFSAMPDSWRTCYEAGVFTEFLEQRAPGHTVLDGKIYAKGMLDFKQDIVDAMAGLDYLDDGEAHDRREQLRAMEICCDALVIFARRHAEAAREQAVSQEDPSRREELLRIAEVCERVPAHAPRDFHEALQHYWFCHLGVITELNGWDAFSPGHLDQHLRPFYEQGLAHGTLTGESAKELIEAFFIKFNNHPAPPKVGVTAAESGTYTDFANINIGGLLRDGTDGSNEVSHLLLEVVDEMHLLQPSTNVQVSKRTPTALLDHALRVIRKGYGFPSLFNADAVVQEQIRQGKSVEDAREGGCSGCVEVGAFGKEAFILTGYFNLVKVLELTLHDGVDPATDLLLGLRTGEPESFSSFDELFDAFQRQLVHFVDIKIRGNKIIERIYAENMPAPFLSVLIDDCIAKGKDYNAGGARYNNTFIQAVGIGTLTDSLSSIKDLVFDSESMALGELVAVLDADFAGREPLRQRMLNKTHKYGNDDEFADELMARAFDVLFEAIDGRPNTKGGHYRLEMLPTTCHIHFGACTGATPDGRRAGRPLSEGISPVQGADRNGPTAVIKSAAKMEHIKTGGTLLNMKFSPSLLAGDDALSKVGHLVRAYFKMDGHHVQFNVVGAQTLRQAQENPEAHRDLIVRVAGYSDYFCDLSRELQDEIITRTEHACV